MTAEDIASKLNGFSQRELRKIDAYERKNENRAMITDKIAKLTGDEPWSGYDELSAEAVAKAIGEGDGGERQEGPQLRARPQGPLQRDRGDGPSHRRLVAGGSRRPAPVIAARIAAAAEGTSGRISARRPFPGRLVSSWAGPLQTTARVVGFERHVVGPTSAFR